MDTMTFVRLVADGDGWRTVQPLVVVDVPPDTNRALYAFQWMMDNRLSTGARDGDVIVADWYGTPMCWELRDGRIQSQGPWSANVLATVVYGDELTAPGSGQ